MKIYALGPFDDGYLYFPTKRAAIKEAKSYGIEEMYVIEMDIGRLTKAVACKLASGTGFAISQKEVWKAKS